MELASDSGGSVGGEAGSYPMVAAPGSNSDLQQLMVAGYGHYVDGRGEHMSKYKVTTSTAHLKLVFAAQIDTLALPCTSSS